MASRKGHNSGDRLKWVNGLRRNVRQAAQIVMVCDHECPARRCYPLSAEYVVSVAPIKRIPTR